MASRDLLFIPALNSFRRLQNKLLFHGLHFFKLLQRNFWLLSTWYRPCIDQHGKEFLHYEKNP